MMEIKQQTLENTGFPYLGCTTCGALVKKAILVVGIRPERDWLRLCDNCVAQLLEELYSMDK